MAIRYDKLEDMLNKKGYKRTDLLGIISSRTLAKLNKNEVITTETIDKICLFLNCQPNDIMEVYVDPDIEFGFDFKKRIYIPNEDRNYTGMQRKLFKEMVKEEIISKESIEKWLKNDIFRKSYEYDEKYKNNIQQYLKDQKGGETFQPLLDKQHNT